MHGLLMDRETRTQAIVGRKSLGTRIKHRSEWTFADNSTVKLASAPGSWQNNDIMLCLLAGKSEGWKWVCKKTTNTYFLTSQQINIYCHWGKAKLAWKRSRSLMSLRGLQGRQLKSFPMSSQHLLLCYCLKQALCHHHHLFNPSCHNI